jgi:hypothetical protein
MQAGGVDVTPPSTPVLTARIERTAPVITSARLVRNATGFDIEVAGYSTAREITQATFKFSAAGGQTLQSTDVTVQLESRFTPWFQDTANARYGSQFVMTQPFTITGDANSVNPESVTLTNRIGSVTASVTK